MTLDEYIKEQEHSLKVFKQHWERMQKLAPDHYPSELETGEWDEQFQLFDPAEILKLPK